VTKEARVGLNGPAVIEQEAGIAEYDTRDRPFIWSFTGGEQRVAAGLADVLVEDDVEKIQHIIASLIQRGIPDVHRSEQIAQFLTALTTVDATLQATPEMARTIYQHGGV
jgi:malonate decarboxylase beta subunit